MEDTIWYLTTLVYSRLSRLVSSILFSRSRSSGVEYSELYIKIPRYARILKGIRDTKDITLEHSFQFI